MRPAAKVAMSGICTALSVLLLAITALLIFIYMRFAKLEDMEVV